MKNVVTYLILSFCFTNSIAPAQEGTAVISNRLLEKSEQSSLKNNCGQHIRIPERLKLLFFYYLNL